VLAWRAQLDTRGLAGATIRRKLAALASLFDHLLENKAVAGGNPVHGVKRPKIETSEGKTPAHGDDQAKLLLEAPDIETVRYEGSSVPSRAAVPRAATGRGCKADNERPA
jgi:site-specific recombinase XerC